MPTGAGRPLCRCGAGAWRSPPPTTNRRDAISTLCSVPCARVQAQDVLWPAVEASLHPVLGGDNAVAKASSAATRSRSRSLNQAVALLSRYGAKMLQQQAWDVEQTISNSLKVRRDLWLDMAWGAATGVPGLATITA